ncbi:type II toxin-antitoxin system VapC family toxin [Pseudonocardia sp. HH130629-09]|uniref:type II toxin-antitoxin system VapC family toxin n=1 Tax=Pseudonocardia sp. HH130629-09 TaxID=1641402 RepID=UPI000AD946F2|nr:type II toxin-antitoxin system VapC family toxin [Pseudonocardia sp. HH130629-09]
MLAWLRAEPGADVVETYLDRPGSSASAVRALTPNPPRQLLGDHLLVVGEWLAMTFQKLAC